MIQAKFYKNNDSNITGYEITGHAEAGPYGSDIVCAAVSAVSIGTTNNLVRLAKIEPEIHADNDNGGELFVSLNKSGEDVINQPATQLLLQNLYLILNDISDEYAEYINLKIEE